MTILLLFWICCAFYTTGWFFSYFSFFKGKEKLHLWAERMLIVGLSLQLFYIARNYIELGDFSFTSLSGLFLFVSLLVIILYFILDFYNPNEIFEIIFPPITILFLILSNTVSDQGMITQQFLDKSPVFGRLSLYVHASSVLFGYLLFGIACLTSVFFLVQEKRIRSKNVQLDQGKLPSLGYLDNMGFKITAVGFVFLTIGLIVGLPMGIISQAGHPSLSLRQGLPVFVWSFYAVFLIDRSLKGIYGRLSAAWSILGFIVVVISFIYEIFILTAKFS